MRRNSKIEIKDRSAFRVKFTNGENSDKKQTSIENKEMILGQRLRALRSFNTMGTKTFGDIQKLQEEPSEESNNSSKRELHHELITPKVVQYFEVNSSAIINDFDVLKSFFDQEVSFKLIYRASNHSFSVEEFHNLCDGIDDTVTICLTEDNKIIGGYTPLTWDDHFHRNSTHFKTDFKRQTFIFSLSDRAKYPLVKSLKNKAICCFKAYGPTFGGGYDLLIGDRSNELPNTTSYFPRNFEHPNMNKFNKRDFTGTSRKNFKLQEWEVFKVVRLQNQSSIQNCELNNDNEDQNNNRGPGIFVRIKNAVKRFFNSLLDDS